MKNLADEYKNQIDEYKTDDIIKKIYNRNAISILKNKAPVSDVVYVKAVETNPEKININKIRDNSQAKTIINFLEKHFCLM